MATPTTSDFLVVPINGTDLIAFYRGSNISRPLYLSYSNFLAILTQAIGGGTKLLLETNSVQNQSQAILNLIQGVGITITDGGNGNITIAATGGTAFITSVSDTADIDLDVTASTLSAALTTTGVTPNTYGSATQVPQITVDSKGRITSVTLVNITAGTGTVTGVTATSPITSSGGTAPNISTLMNTNKIIGRYDVGTGVMQEVSVGAGLSISGSSLIATGSASGGSSISYYLNGGTPASVLTYYQMSKTAVVGTNVDFPLAGNGLITQWLTDVGDPNRIEIPAGNWNFEIYMSADSAGGTPAFYVELLKYDGTFTTIANSSAAPEDITGGTSIDLYLTSLAIPQTTLLATDRLALRVYIVNSVPGRTITMHTQDSHLCQVITNFAGGIVSINGVGANTQFLITGTDGTAFNIDSTSIADTHKFNIPLASTASVTAGLISNANFNTFNGKQDALTATKSVKIVSSNVELDNDETSPTARKFYSTSSAAARGWRAIEKLDLPTIISSGALPYIEREYIAATGASNSNGGSAIIKIPGSNVIFAAYTTGNTVVAYDSTTAAVLSTTTVAGAVGLVYVATTGQVWAFGSTAASITRFTATTGVSLGATVVTGLTASCRGVYDDSSVTGNVYAYNGATMNVIVAATYVRTGVAIGAGTGSNELVLVTSGVQSGLLVGTVNIGVFGFNKSTNTLAYAPTTAFSSPTIKYIPSLNKIITVSASVSSIYVYTPATATTITLSSTIAGVFLPNYIDFDETENYLFVISGFTGSFPMKLSIFDLTTLVMVKSMPLTAITSSGVGYIAIDKPNKCLYVVGFAVGSSINKIVYA